MNNIEISYEINVIECTSFVVQQNKVNTLESEIQMWNENYLVQNPLANNKPIKTWNEIF